MPSSSAAARQVMCLGPGDDGVPDGVHAGGKALQAVLHQVQHTPVVALYFIARVAQYKRAAGRWRQKFLDTLKTVLGQHGHLAAGLQLGHVAGQGACVGGVQLEQFQLVLIAQQALGNEGRAGIDARDRALVEGAHHVHIVLQRGRQRRRRGGRHQAQNAVGGFGAGGRIVAVQPVQTRPCMCIQYRQSRVFL